LKRFGLTRARPGADGELMAGPQIKSEVQSLVRVFEALLSTYLARAMRGQGNQKPFLDKLAELRGKHPALADLAVDKVNWQVKLNLKIPVPADDLLDWLAETTDSMVDVSLIEFGNLGALREASALARDILGRFGDEPARLGIPYSILSGSLVRRRPLGAEGLDGLLDDGIPDGHQLLLVSPAIPELSALIAAIIGTEIRAGGKAIDILVSRSPAEYAEWLGASGVDVSAALRSQRLALMDWRANPDKRVSAVEMSDGLCRLPLDPVHIETAIATSVAHINRGPGRAFIDLGEVIRRAGVDNTVNMLKGMFRRLRRAGMTTLYYIDENDVGAEIVAGIVGRFDGLLRVRERTGPGALARAGETGASRRWEIGFEAMVGASFNPEFRPVAEIDGSLVVGTHSFAPVASPGDDGESESDLVDMVLGRPDDEGTREAATRSGPNFVEVVELWKLAGYNVRALEAAGDLPESERSHVLRLFERDTHRLYALRERFMNSGVGMAPRERLAFLRLFADPDRMSEIEARLVALGIAVPSALPPPVKVSVAARTTQPAAASAPETPAVERSLPLEPKRSAASPPLSAPQAAIAEAETGTAAPERPEPAAEAPAMAAPATFDELLAPLKMDEPATSAPIEPAAPHPIEPTAPPPIEPSAAPARGKSFLDKLGAAFGAPAKPATMPAKAVAMEKAAVEPDLKSIFSPDAAKRETPALKKPIVPVAMAPATVPSRADDVPRPVGAPVSRVTDSVPSAVPSPKPARPKDDLLSAAFGVKAAPQTETERPKPSPPPESTSAATPLTDRISSLFKSTIVSTKRVPSEVPDSGAPQSSLYLRAKPATTQARSSPVVRDDSRTARPATDGKKTLILESALERVFGVKIKPAPPPPVAEPGKPLKSCRVCEFELPHDENPCRYCGSKQ